jgi:hypothetical protein
VSSLREYLQLWLRWQKGRQNSGYDKLLLAAVPFPIPFDRYLLRFPEGSQIPPHRDPVRAGRQNPALIGDDNGNYMALAPPTCR